MPSWRILLASLGVTLVATAGCMTLLSAGDAPGQEPWAPSQGQAAAAAYANGTAPRVIVGLPDSGINPYHEAFHRPGLTEHPCTYLEGVPCTIQKLPLSVGEYDDYEAAVQADRHLWEDVEEGTVYWVPETNVIAATCQEGYEREDRDWGECILDVDGHGTAAASSVVTENPKAFLAIEHGDATFEHLDAHGVPLDVRSVSWQSTKPDLEPDKGQPVYVISAGNEPWSTLMDGWSGHPSHVAVGGGYPHGATEEAATRQPDVVSYYCRPVAAHDAVTQWRTACGTSFSAPTVAGALSKVILDVREHTGYEGGLESGVVDPEHGLTVGDLRDAMNRTASYEPTGEYATDAGGVPVQEHAPWLDWGWGFYDGKEAEATTEALLGDDPAQEKPEEAREYMAAQQTVRERLYG